jgi:hypothetical protein
VAVGEHFTNARYPAQLVETGDANGFSPVAFRNPKGDSWSVLGDVSCASATFCLLVGDAGTTRRTAHGLRYLSHASAFRWNGRSLRRLTAPAPARARAAELSGVSCASATSCVAVGVADRPGTAAFAERYAAGRWSVLRIVPRRRSAFYRVSCPAAATCVAAGQQGTRSLIERWNGSRWLVQAVPATARPLTTDALFHVSCVTAAVCTAVGYRHNPRARYSYHTLALGWNGTAWTVQKTSNQ